MRKGDVGAAAAVELDHVRGVVGVDEEAGCGPGHVGHHGDAEAVQLVDVVAAVEPHLVGV